MPQRQGVDVEPEQPLLRIRCGAVLGAELNYIRKYSASDLTLRFGTACSSRATYPLGQTSPFRAALAVESGRRRETDPFPTFVSRLA
jgi:hypothetical protein